MGGKKAVVSGRGGTYFNPSTRRAKVADLCEFKVIQMYIVNFRLARLDFQVRFCFFSFFLIHWDSRLFELSKNKICWFREHGV